MPRSLLPQPATVPRHRPGWRDALARPKAPPAEDPAFRVYDPQDYADRATLPRITKAPFIRHAESRPSTPPSPGDDSPSGEACSAPLILVPSASAPRYSPKRNPDTPGSMHMAWRDSSRAARVAVDRPPPPQARSSSPPPPGERPSLNRCVWAASACWACSFLLTSFSPSFSCYASPLRPASLCSWTPSPSWKGAPSIRRHRQPPCPPSHMKTTRTWRRMQCGCRRPPPSSVGRAPRAGTTGMPPPRQRASPPSPTRRRGRCPWPMPLCTSWPRTAASYASAVAAVTVGLSARPAPRLRPPARWMGVGSASTLTSSCASLKRSSSPCPPPHRHPHPHRHPRPSRKTMRRSGDRASSGPASSSAPDPRRWTLGRNVPSLRPGGGRAFHPPPPRHWS